MRALDPRVGHLAHQGICARPVRCTRLKSTWLKSAGACAVALPQHNRLLREQHERGAAARTSSAASLATALCQCLGQHCPPRAAQGCKDLYKQRGGRRTHLLSSLSRHHLLPVLGQRRPALAGSPSTAPCALWLLPEQQRRSARVAHAAGRCQAAAPRLRRWAGCAGGKGRTSGRGNLQRHVGYTSAAPARWGALVLAP